ncbi:WD40/YVTN/BNR-like repeat-containing protein [Pseudomonas sp. B1-22]|uniref:WD40/YVTN/BNR-like repeat-containing protein n=1 Tax=Pseudomonas sp. B1-22 TaxID=3141456 RepID=UPI003D2D1EB5
MGFKLSSMAGLMAIALPLSAVSAAPLQPAPATVAVNATAASMLAAVWATDHLVAVGDHGVVLLTDAQGRNLRQAHSVPLSSPLTGVSFVDAQQGWAVGHWGAIVQTTDGGNNWQIQRVDTEVDRPLFAVHFFDSQHGVAVGLWSLVLTTDDGGKTWSEQTLTPPPGAKRADLNLMGLFSDTRGTLYAPAERGQLLRSDDRGKSWSYIDTGYNGTLWSGAVLEDGSLLVGGQRGTLLHGNANGQGWQRVPLQSKGSITAISVSGRQVLAVGLDGLMVKSVDGGQRFEEQQAPESVSLTASVLDATGSPMLFSQRGVLAGQ